MNQITQNISDIHERYSQYNFTLVAVSKTKPVSDLQSAYDGGQRHFGENKAQELVEKWETLPKDIKWHMIGHLQRNKVKYIAPFVHLIHGIDSERLLNQVNKEGQKAGRKIDCLLQVHIAKEETKFGFSEDEINSLFNEGRISNLEYVNVKGLMGMATNTDDTSIVASEFSSLKSLFDNFKNEFNLDTLSMGMSGDFPLALQSGSNMIRVGSLIFGKRNYAI
ncbi:MAG: YggS family pyridoxal phosphate-dependent enzyme [Bacteroidota bacterium]